MVKEKEICSTLVVTPQAAKVRATVRDKCIVKREKEFKLVTGVDVKEKQ